MKGSTPAKKFIRGLAALVFWLAVWEALALIVDKELLLPGPWRVLTSLLALARTAVFWKSTVLTLLRILLGFVVGVVFGTLIGVFTAWKSPVDTLLSPAVRIVRATPVASFIILALVWVKTGNIPMLISALMVTPVVWANVRQGINAASGELLEMARVYKFGRGKTVKLIYIPAVFPYFKAACITSLGLAWKSGIAAEVLCQPRWALGASLYYSKLHLETAELFAWTAVIIILSMLLERLLTRLVKRWEAF